MGREVDVLRGEATGEVTGEYDGAQPESEASSDAESSDVVTGDDRDRTMLMTAIRRRLCLIVMR